MSKPSVLEVCSRVAHPELVSVGRGVMLSDLLDELREAKAEIYRLNNKLNTDSQAFELECKKATIERLRRELEEARAKDYERFNAYLIDMRNIVGTVCNGCGGVGVKSYSSTATWHGGIGGQTITSDVCDRCWGSGDIDRPWTDLRKFSAVRKAQEGK